jgi:DNA-directed RNA polymerase specialized sigma24 family protein
MAQLSEDDELRALLTALVALMVDEREARILSEPAPTKTELLLARAGLSTQAIARVLGKHADAVRKTLSRARQRDTKIEDADDA